LTNETAEGRRKSTHELGKFARTDPGDTANMPWGDCPFQDSQGIDSHDDYAASRPICLGLKPLLSRNFLIDKEHNCLDNLLYW